MSKEHTEQDPSAFTDPVLIARMEAIRLLGQRLNEPVTVVDGHLNLLYLNEQAQALVDARSAGVDSRRCYTALMQRTEPCPVCHASEVFKTGLVHPNPGWHESRATCGPVQAFPITSSEGEAAAVLQILEHDEPSDPAKPPPRRFEHVLEQSETGRLGDLIGYSAPMQELFEMIKLVSVSRATVLVQGESGTGKELVARTIHALSGRREKRFVVVDCSSLPETLLESELFGHLKGAFTGAVLQKKGLFEEADGGTVFLDEIADTTPRFQAKLLRVLQEGQIKPVGSSRSIHVDVRIVSATNKDLMEAIKAKAFREDLYYRLAVLPLVLPPLRERREDIPLLVRHFIDLSCRRHGKPMREITTNAMHALMQAPWRGNVRELQHAIERALVTSAGPALVLQDFSGGDVSMDSAPCVDLRSVTRDAVHLAERARIAAALRQASGKRAQAARVLKISRSSLYNKLRAYRIG